MPNYKRGQYNEILRTSLNAQTLKQVDNLFKEVCNSEKIDEHGNWEFGASFDYKGRGAAVNWDIYEVGKDAHSKRLLAIIQIRKYEKRKKNYFPTIQKSYFLIGRNEDNTAFAHPVESRVIHAAVKKGSDAILAVQNWMFDCKDYREILRQGDLCFIPLKSTSHLKDIKVVGNELMLQESHILNADEVRVNGTIYAKNPYLKHLPKTHPDIKAKGWCKVVVAKRGKFHEFAQPTID